MSLTGAELKTHILGPEIDLENTTSYTPSLENARTVLDYAYGDGEHYYARVHLTQADMAALSGATKADMLALVESKITST